MPKTQPPHQPPHQPPPPTHHSHKIHHPHLERAGDLRRRRSLCKASMAIGDSLKERLRAKFTRRYSTASSCSQSSADGEAQASLPSPDLPRKAPRSLRPRSKHSIASLLNRSAERIDEKDEEKDDEKDAGDVDGAGIEQTGATLEPSQGSSDLRETSSKKLQEGPLQEVNNNNNLEGSKHDSSSTADFPTPKSDIAPLRDEVEGENALRQENGGIQFTNSFATPPTHAKAPELSRRQSLLPAGQTRLIKTLLETDLASQSRAPSLDYFTQNAPTTITPSMVSRKIWVKRPNASATLVTIHEDDLVDDVRDMILRKYANSLGRTFDSPDVTLRIVAREQRQERTLGPEEPMGRTLDAYFPGGQTVDEALIIDVPVKRTPKPSPQPQQRGYYDENRPAEGGSDYFPPMPMPAAPSPHLPNVLPVNGDPARYPALAQHSMSVLTTGHVPALPSPGGTRRHGAHREKPRIGRTHTSSPTVGALVQHGIPGQQVLSNGTQVYLRAPRSRTHSNASEQSNAPPTAPPLPTPPAQQANDIITAIQRVSTPPPQAPSPRSTNTRQKRNKKSNSDHPSLPAGMLNGSVPPINVLIVEDNIINLKLLEAFMKRLKVRWQTAIDGREAVTKWRAGGFHLVLMDIQLPIMNGLEATKEIRRLERLNNIGVFSSSASSSAPEKEVDNEPEAKDKLPSTVLFKSPVIIVALTASSLQSDRHEALAAGCNDFLTKPVNFVWLERKVMEWGCMQALIDFDGWRKWKDFSQGALTEKEEVKAKEKSKKKKANRMSLGSNSGAGSSTSRLAIREESAGEGVAVG